VLAASDSHDALVEEQQSGYAAGCFHGVTHLKVGASPFSSWRELLGTSLPLCTRKALTPRVALLAPRASKEVSSAWW